MAPLIWFVTGATSGLGLALVHEIAARGDKVIATGRNVESKIGHFRPDNVAFLELDVGADRAELTSKFKQAWDIFGNIDILLNNAGVSRGATGEEASDELIEHIFNINAFGPMRLAQAALPLFRAQGHGKLLFVANPGTWTLPFISHYSAAKSALCTWTYALSTETRALGIECMVVETGGFRSTLGHPRPGFRGGEGFGAVPPGPAYEPLFKEFAGGLAADPEMLQPGDPIKVAARIVDAAKLEGMAAGKAFPLHLTLGSDSVEVARIKIEKRLEWLAEWEEVGRSTDREVYNGSVTKLITKLSAGLEE